MTSRLLTNATQIIAIAMILSAVLLLVAICVLVVCIVGRAFRRGLSTIGRGERYNEKEKGLSPEEVERLPCYDFKIGGDKGVGLLDCAVCLEIFQNGDKCRLLPACSHSFHAQCVDSWLMKTPICPICRSKCCSSMQGR